MKVKCVFSCDSRSCFSDYTVSLIELRKLTFAQTSAIEFTHTVLLNKPI